jgi:hypothetical protein
MPYIIGIMSAEGLLDDPALFIRKTINTTAKTTIDDQGLPLEERKILDSEICIKNTAYPDKLYLALEYLDLVRTYPVKIKSVIFHIRRIIRDELTDFQLMEECIKCENNEDIRTIVNKAIEYKKDKNNYIYDKDKEKKMKEEYEKRKKEEGKRKLFEDRMIRKAKREKKEDLNFYLVSKNPSFIKLKELKCMETDKAFDIWKKEYSQHCYNFHFDANGCHRDRTCSFLHFDVLYAETDDTDVAWG